MACIGYAHIGNRPFPEKGQMLTHAPCAWTKGNWAQLRSTPVPPFYMMFYVQTNLTATNRT